MSGGSYDYTCFKIEEEYCGRMFDAELDEMMKDVADLTYELEWWRSGDVSEEKYRDTANKFKKKWFGSRDERLAKIIEAKCEELKTELLKMIGENERSVIEKTIHNNDYSGDLSGSCITSSLYHKYHEDD